MVNTIIIITALAMLLVLFMLTMWSVLAQEKTQAEAAWDELDKVWVKRRDTVPYLLESARIDDGRWKALKDKRTQLMSNQIERRQRLDLEEQLGNAIEAMIAVAREHEEVRHSTGFMEAEKDLRKDIPVEIDEVWRKFKASAEDYNDKLVKFPYIIAAKVFRLQII